MTCLLADNERGTVRKNAGNVFCLDKTNKYNLPSSTTTNSKPFKDTTSPKENKADEKAYIEQPTPTHESVGKKYGLKESHKSDREKEILNTALAKARPDSNEFDLTKVTGEQTMFCSKKSMKMSHVVFIVNSVRNMFGV